MDFETFIKTVSGKIGNQAAFGQLGEVKTDSIVELLIEKAIFTKEEYDNKIKELFAARAEMFMKMPFPSPLSDIK